MEQLETASYSTPHPMMFASLENSTNPSWSSWPITQDWLRFGSRVVAWRGKHCGGLFRVSIKYQVNLPHPKLSPLKVCAKIHFYFVSIFSLKL